MPLPANLIRKLPILVIFATAIIGAIFLRDQFSFAALADNRMTLLAFRDAHFIWASVGFIAAYFLIVGLSLPGATIATLAGGFLFGMFPGAIYNVAGASLGAIAVFIAARAGFGADVAAKMQSGSGPVARLQAALQKNEWSALLVMRLVPALPFFLANLIPAFVGARLDRYAITTVVGIIPGALVFTSIGAGLGDVFARGQTPELGVIFTLPVLLPLLGLAALALVPVVMKALRGKDA